MARIAINATVIANPIRGLPNQRSLSLSGLVATISVIVAPDSIPKECATRGAASSSSHSPPIAQINHSAAAVIPTMVPSTDHSPSRSSLSIGAAGRVLASQTVITLHARYTPSTKMACATALMPIGLLLVTQYSGTAIIDIAAAAMPVNMMTASLDLPRYSSTSPPDVQNTIMFSAKCLPSLCRKA